MRPSQAILVLEKLKNSSSTPLYRKGLRLSHEDTQTVMEVYQQWILLLMDLGYLSPEELQRTGTRLWSDMLRVDVLELNNSFAKCLQLVRLQSNKGFKGLCSVISCHLYNLLRDDIQLITSGDVYAAGRLMQAFAYTSRLTLHDIDLTDQMLEEYVRNEESILTTPPPLLTKRLNKVMRRWVQGFDPARIFPRHGQGGTAEHGRVSVEQKYKYLSSDQLLEYAFGEPTWQVAPKRLSRVSKTIFVPKSYKTFRTISMEPTTLMYFQQGVWGAVDDMIRSNPYLRRRIDVHDQTRNMLLAQQGSICRNYATIDLSSASDLVSYDLVKQVFRGTRLLRYIVATRSRETVLPDGRQITLKKFAPMGSALCFPIETLIFASICEIVTREFRAPLDYSVYGDDIIVPTQCAERVMHVLGLFGFRVNREKSYYAAESWFRESCGGEYCDGHDVTPMRLSRSYASLERGVRLQALIDSANAAYVRHYRYLRGFFILQIRRTGFNPLFAPTSLLSDNYTNYQSEQRWNRNLQRLEVKISILESKFLKDDLDHQDESIRYRHWLESTQTRKYADDGFLSVVCKPTEVFLEAWREKPFEPSDQGLIDYYTTRMQSTLRLH